MNQLKLRQHETESHATGEQFDHFLGMKPTIFCINPQTCG